MASVTVTPDLQRAMARDVARFTLTRPRIVVVWVILALVLVLEIGGFAAQAAHGGLQPGLSWIVTIAALVLPPYLVLATARSTRRAVAAAFPVDSTADVEAAGDRLRIATVRGSTDVAVSTFNRIGVLRDAVVLQQPTSRVGILLPRAAFDPAELDHLRGRIAR